MILGLGATAPAAGTSVLFVGNSFTFGAGSAVQFYRANTVSDLNNEGKGGVPASFKSFTTQAGLKFTTSPSKLGAAATRSCISRTSVTVLGTRPWDKVVMHGQSTLDFAKPGNTAKDVRTSRQMAEFFRGINPKVEMYLMATWSRADQTYPATGTWSGRPIEEMARRARRLRQGRRRAGRHGGDPGGRSVDARDAIWPRRSDPYDGIEAGKLNLWTYDHYHASTYGYYLEALVVFGSLTGRDRDRSARTNVQPSNWAYPPGRQGAAADRLRSAWECRDASGITRGRARQPCTLCLGALAR